MIKAKNEMPVSERIIDLTGPDGNAFALLGIAKSWTKQLGLDWNTLQAEMTSGDYEKLLSVMDREFGDFVTFYR